MMQIPILRTMAPQDEQLGSPKLLYTFKLDERDLLHPRSSHLHTDTVEFVYILSSEGEYEISNTRYPVQAGDLIIYNSGVVHNECDNQQKIPIVGCAATGIALPGLPPNAMVPAGMNPVFHLGDQHRLFRQLMLALFDKAQFNQPHTPEICQALFMTLFYLILDRISTNDTSNGENDPDVSPLSASIRSYVDQQPVNAVSVPEIAKKFDISESYLARIFKRSFGYSLTSHLIQRRVGEAQTLLLTTDLSLIEIAHRIGYDNQSYFTKVFTQHIGLSPLRYRKLYKNVAALSERNTERGAET